MAKMTMKPIKIRIVSLVYFVVALLLVRAG